MTHSFRLSLATLLIVVFTMPSLLAAGTLSSARGKVRSSGKSESKSERKRKNDNDDDDEDNEGGSIAGGILMGAVKQVFSKDDEEEPKPRRKEKRSHRGGRHHDHHNHHRPARSPVSLGLHFSSRPEVPPPVYVAEHHHFYGDATYTPTALNPTTYGEPIYGEQLEALPSPSDAPPVPAPVDPIFTPHPAATPSIAPPPMEFCNPWHVRFGMEYGSDTDDLSQFGFDLLANKTAGFGIDTSVRMHRERGYDFRDHLWLGDFNIVYELFPTKNIRPRAGIGVNWLADNFGGEAGLNLTFGVDATVWEKLKLTGELDYGTLGDADFLHARATVGYAVTENVEWFAGYDHIDISGVDIDGIITGMRFRF